MTLIAVQASPKQAVVAADTAISHPDDDSGRHEEHGTKLFTIPHLNAVMVGRGCLPVISKTAYAAMVGQPSATLDGTVDVIADVLEAQIAEAHEVAAACADTDPDIAAAAGQSCQAFLVGAEGGKVRGFGFIPDEGIMGQEFDNGVVGSLGEYWGKADFDRYLPPSVESACKLMRAMYQTLAERLPAEGREELLDWGYGGAVTTADIRANGTITVQCHPQGTLMSKRQMAQANATSRPGKHDRCPCGSGKKYMKCCRGREAVAA